MNEEPRFWQLDALSKELKQSFSTVNRWFNDLEHERIHYVGRAVDGNRVYTEMDLKIGLYIKHLRGQRWNLSGIYAKLVDEPEIELRPFPEDFKDDNQNQLSADNLIQDMSNALNDRFAELLKKQEDYFNLRLQELKNSTESLGQSRLEMRQKDITDMITNNRITNILRIEALEAWSKLPESERTIKKGLFRKEEDTIKKDRFIAEYEIKNYADRLRKETEEEMKHYADLIQQKMNSHNTTLDEAQKKDGQSRP